MVYIIIGFINLDFDEVMTLILGSQPKLKHEKKNGQIKFYGKHISTNEIECK